MNSHTFFFLEILCKISCLFKTLSPIPLLFARGLFLCFFLLFLTLTLKGSLGREGNKTCTLGLPSWKRSRFLFNKLQILVSWSHNILWKEAIDFKHHNLSANHYYITFYLADKNTRINVKFSSFQWLRFDWLRVFMN